LGDAGESTIHSLKSRSFMYGAAALGDEGGNHTIVILKRQLQQVMDQLCCATVTDFPEFLVK